MEQYGLGVILYSFLNKEELSSPYYIISKYILENMDSIKTYSITDLAEKCNVSTATISRFCRKVGLDSFFELKMVIYNNYLISKPQYTFKVFSDKNDSIYDSYLDSVIENIKILKNNIDFNLIDELVDDLYLYKKISAFGAMHMENTALALQSDLFRCRKIIDTRLSLPRQIEYIKQSGKDNLIIIFTFSGKYIEESLIRAFDWQGNDKPKIYVVTSNKKVTELKYIDKTIVLPSSNHDFAAHPHGMNLICSMISLKYYDKFVKKYI